MVIVDKHVCPLPGRRSVLIISEDLAEPAGTLSSSTMDESSGQDFRIQASEPLPNNLALFLAGAVRSLIEARRDLNA